MGALCSYNNRHWLTPRKQCVFYPRNPQCLLRRSGNIDGTSPSLEQTARKVFAWDWLAHTHLLPLKGARSDFPTECVRIEPWNAARRSPPIGKRLLVERFNDENWSPYNVKHSEARPTNCLEQRFLLFFYYPTKSVFTGLYIICKK